MEGDATENGSQGHAFDASFTGVGEKACSVLCMGSIRFGRKPFSHLRVSVPRDRFLLGGTKNSSCGHITPGLLGKDFGQDFSGFERDDLDEHVCFLEFLPSGACFSFKRSQYIDLHLLVCHLLKPRFGHAIYARSLSSSQAKCLGRFFFPTVALSSTP